MTGLNSGRFGSVRSKCTVMVLMLCFCVISLFGSPLHDHDLESSHVDLDCISCHLVHSNIGLDQDDPDISTFTEETQLVSIATTPSLIADKFSVSSRAPPVIC